MINKIDLKKLDIISWYYIIVILGYVLTLISSSIRPGVIATALMLLVIAQLCIQRRIKIENTIDSLAVVFFVYNMLSGLWCVYYGMSLSIFLGEFVTGALPIIFYFAGKTSLECTEDFYKKFIIAVIIAGTVGLVLFIWAPQFYLDYLFNYNYISKADAATMRIRMISVIGSILVGYLSVCGMCIASGLMLKYNGKKYKAALFVCCLYAFLSNQRSAMFVAILVLFYVNYLVFFVYKMLHKKYFIYECSAFVAGFILMCIVFFKAILKVYYRLVSLPGAIGQRSDQWVGAVNNMKNLWLGNGLGASGHRAVYLNDYIVADGGLVKLFCEMGIIGTSVFAFMLILLIKKGSKKLLLCAGEIGLIIATLLQSIGSNILEFQLATPIFYFAVGRIAYIIASEKEDESI